jgi:hypothetical protein
MTWPPRWWVSVPIVAGFTVLPGERHSFTVRTAADLDPAALVSPGAPIRQPARPMKGCR